MKQHALTHKNGGGGVKESPSRSSSNPNSDTDNPRTPTASVEKIRITREQYEDSSNDNSRPEGMMKRSPPSDDPEDLPMSKRPHSKLQLN